MKTVSRPYQLRLRRLVYSALFLALALVLPFLTGQIPQIGSALSPMHIPVLLCGFVCGWPWGLAVGFIAPLLRHLLFGMPPLITAIAMAFELAAYGAVTGLLYRLLPKRPGYIYVSLVSAMVLGRVVWGCARFVIAGLQDTTFRAHPHPGAGAAEGRGGAQWGRCGRSCPRTGRGIPGWSPVTRSSWSIRACWAAAT